ncbi:MAG: hypothetical protein KatS3mg043_1006 [Rhodothermaceae bacterium]|nr:MAG: hypothetical protein KatS3mg043_1006 [Rhodothermaceae bacterium]
MVSCLACRRWVVVAVLLWGIQAAGTAYGQAERYALAMRGVPLEEALARFVAVTGVALAYDPALVGGRRVYCVVQDETAEGILRCLLDGTGLDFYRRSSGTYVLTRPVALPPQYAVLAGAVVDARTRAPLPYAHVVLADRGLGTTTNGAGQFAFPQLLPGRYAVAVSHLGYRVWQDTLVLDAGGSAYVRAALAAEPVPITPIVVDASDVEPGDGVRARVDRQEPPVGFATETGMTSFRPLQALAGVRLSDATADVHVQGGAAGDHLLRLDGVPVFMPRQTVGFIGPFSPLALARITVHRAGFGAEAGSQTAGVLEAEHLVESGDGFEAQVDPLSLNARLSLRTGPEEAPRVALMAAVRAGPWAAYQPAALRRTLRRWSTPDPFVLLAPLRRYQDIDPDFFRETLLLDPDPEPRLAFSDLHAALRWHPAPLRTLYASFYRGRKRLAGDLFPDAALRESFALVNTQGLVTVEDTYDWAGGTGQVRYDAVLGGPTLWSVQARAGHYRFDHDYQFFEALALDIDEARVQLGGPATRRTRDGNRVTELGLAASLDHTRGAHHVQLGLEGTVTDSRFDLRLASIAEGTMSLQVRPVLEGNAPLDLDSTATFTMVHRQVRHAARATRVAAFARDRIRLGAAVSVEAGVRLTYRPGRQTVYAEPRLAATYTRAVGGLGPVTVRLAAGLYRQFVSQFDLSVLNAGALLSTARIWLPLDASVRPPKVYHLAPAVTLTPGRGWTVRLDGYLKHQPHGLTINYAADPAGLPADGKGPQNAFLTSFRARYYGGSVALERKGERLRVRAAYTRSVARWHSDDLFDGRRVSFPWNEPHRLDLGVDWLPAERFTLSLRAYGVRGQTWALRRAYYDYFGHSPRTRYHPPYDLGDPDAHRLPDRYGLDLGAAYTHPLGPARLQLRLDVLNLLNRANVADRRLVFDGDGLSTAPRLLPPRFVAFAARVSW